MISPPLAASPARCDCRSGGFTLTELLVASAILAVLIALLMPTFSVAQSRGRSSKCLSNLRQLTAAWGMDTGENGGRLVESKSGWARGGNTLAAIEQGDLFPYVKNTAVYRCPSDESNHFRSGSMSGKLGSVSGGRPALVATLSAFPNPARTLLLIEENDPRGFNMGSWIIGGGSSWIDFCPA